MEEIMFIVAVFGGLILAGALLAALKNVGASSDRDRDKLNIP